MSEKDTTNSSRDIRQFCMERGTIVGIITSASFLCSMYGLSNFLLGQVSNLLGLLAIAMAGTGIRNYRREKGNITFGRACWMAMLTYFYAILLTALTQYIYFAFLDHGMLLGQLQKFVEMPEYRQLLQHMAGEEDIDTMIQTTLGVLGKPAQATMQFMWVNCFASLLFTIPTALIGITGKLKKED